MEHALHHKARIHARAQKAADLNIGNLVRAHGIREHFLYTIGPFVKRQRFVNLVLKLVVARRFKRARGKVPRKPAGGLQLIHAFEQGFLVGKVLIRQIIRNFFAHNFFHETRMIQETLDFRAEQKLPVFVVVVERLDAEDVARAEQLTRLRVPNDEREHAAQLIKHAATPFLVAVKDGLGVGMRGKRVARRQQFFAKLLVVVDFAVEHNDLRAVFVRHGLASALKVDNGQATMRQRHEIVHVERGVIGTAMRNAIAHQLRHAQGVAHRIGNSKTGKTAHIRSLSVKVLMPPGLDCWLDADRSHFPVRATLGAKPLACPITRKPQNQSIYRAFYRYISIKSFAGAPHSCTQRHASTFSASTIGAPSMRTGTGTSESSVQPKIIPSQPASTILRHNAQNASASGLIPAFTWS